MNDNDTRKLIAGLKTYFVSLESHLNQMNADFQQLENQWRAFNSVAQGNYADQFSGGWTQTQAKFKEYINQSDKIKVLLEKRLKDLMEFDREENSLNAGATINSTTNTNLSDNANILAEATINICKHYRNFQKNEKELFLLELNLLKKDKQKMPTVMVEGLAFENFYTGTQIDRVMYDIQFHHNPEEEKRRADAFAIFEEEGEEVISLIEIMRSGKQFNSNNGRKFYQARAYGNTLGHSLVLGKPVKIKYVFLEELENNQLSNLQAAVKEGIERAVEHRYQELVQAGEPPSNLTKNVNIDVEIEIWQGK